MAYNGGFPMNYGYYAPQIPQPAPMQAPMPAPQQQNGSMVWVQGEAGAKSYLLTPNTTLPLWDSEAQVIYLKSSDASGMPSMKVLDYTVRENSNTPHTAPLNNKDEYVTKEEFEALREELKTMKENMGA